MVKKSKLFFSSGPPISVGIAAQSFS